MTRQRLLLILLIGAAGVALGWVLTTTLSRTLQTTEAAPGGEEESEPDPSPAAPPEGTDPAVPRIQATLFFGSADGRGLVGVEREVPFAEGVVGQARALVEAQLAAEPPDSLVRTIPDGTTLRALFVTDRNEAFIDLDATVRDRHPGGSLNELLTVYTLVNVVTTNLPDIQRVQILIDGREADTLAGHVDLRRPLRKNEALILTP